jgi:hypothetical protein
LECSFAVFSLGVVVGVGGVGRPRWGRWWAARTPAAATPALPGQRDDARADDETTRRGGPDNERDDAHARAAAAGGPAGPVRTRAPRGAHRRTRSPKDARLVGEKKIKRGAGELGRACATTYDGGGGARGGAQRGGVRGVDSGEDDAETKTAAAVRVRRL